MLFRFFAIILLALPGLAAATATLGLDKLVVERFMGLGVQWDPHEYPLSPSAWKLTIARVDFMQPRFLRVMWRAHEYCLGFDASGHPKYVWDEGDEAAAKRLGPLFAILDYAQSRNIDVMLGEWDPPLGLKTGKAPQISGPGDPRWARIITDFLAYLTKVKKYTVIRYYNYMNEPNGNWMWPAPDFKVDYAAWASGIRTLRASFDANGLKGLPIAGPDNSGDWDWLDRCAKELAPQIGLWEMHWYAKDSELATGAVEKLLRAKREMLVRTDPRALAKGLYMGEAGIIEGRVNGDQQPRVKTFVYGVLMADYVAQVARAGWMGAAAWDLDDAMHVVNGREHLPVPNENTLKVWGFWNTQGSRMGHPEDEAIRPWFYTWSLMSRLFPKGARILTSSRPGPYGVRAIAATWTDAADRRVSVMVVNNSDAVQSVQVRVPGLGSRSLTPYRYFENERPVDRDGYPVPSGEAVTSRPDSGIKVELPSRGVVILTTAPTP